MRKNLVIIITICFFTGCMKTEKESAMPMVSSGKIERIENFPSHYISPRNVDIWLPETYDASESYPVLYMHDGQMLFDSSVTWNHQEWGVDETISKLIKQETIQTCIVVGVWNSGSQRHADYFPQKPFESLPAEYQDSLLQEAKRYGEAALFSTTVQSDNYLKFLTLELKPFIDKNYSTKPGRDNTFIAGSSMGGLISMYAICEYPEVFGGAGCLSTHWTGTFTDKNNPIPQTFIDYLSENLPNPSTCKMYFDYGTEGLDEMYEPYQIRVDSIMAARGYDNLNWKTMKFTGENHSENAWRKRLHTPLTFLMGNQNLNE